MYLLVKVHILEAQLEQLLVELHTFSDFLKVNNVLKTDLEQADRLDERLRFEPLAEDGSGLARKLALFEAQVDNTRLEIDKLKRRIALLRRWQFATLLLLLF